MVSKAARIDALVARALHDGTPIEEARTSALLALRLMKRQGTVQSRGPDYYTRLFQFEQLYVARCADLNKAESRAKELEAECRAARSELGREQDRAESLARQLASVSSSLAESRQEIARVKGQQGGDARAKAVVDRIERGLRDIPKKPAKKPAGRWIQSRYEGWCRACGKPYAVGAKVLWSKGSGALCASCATGRT